MFLKLYSLFLYWIFLLISANGVNSATTQASEESSGKSTITSQNGYTDSDTDWLPRLNVTCMNEELLLLNNPKCVGNKLNQTRKECSPGVFKSSTSFRGCVTSFRNITCSANQVCGSWSRWNRLSDCCLNDSCEFYGVSVNYKQAVYNRTRNCRNDIGSDCTKEIHVHGCKEGRQASGSGSGKLEGTSGSATRVIAFSLSGAVMVGLLLFAGLRLRRAATKRERATPYDGNDHDGIDNEMGPLSPDSRIQTILNTINTNGRNYELRERSDSIPGRRVYVLSPTPQDPNANRGRIFSRATSQLSSIAEEDTEDALSHITEGTEPRDDDNVFRYDSDAINEVDNMSSPVISNGCAIQPANSSEALDCIDDVIAMYDVDNDVTENENIEAILRESTISPNADFRISESQEKDDYLNNFGWKPQERSWKLEKLKDENLKSSEKLFASCSTLNSRFSEKSLQSSQNSIVTSHSTASVSDRLPSNGDVTDMTFSSLRKDYKSLPSLLDTSQIPDIDEVLGNNVESQECYDVVENGYVHV